MSLKEFDTKQFLLEKGEVVGLYSAIALMVLMLILSLFMPGSGFFSGSPKEKALALKKDTDQLDNSLRTKQPSEKDLPEKREGRLIDIDTRELKADSFAPGGLFFEPRIRENPARRPPRIYNVDEAIVAIAHVPIDVYLFDKNFEKIWVLVDKDGRRSSGGGGGANSFNPFLQLSKGGGMMGSGGMPQGMMGGMRGGMGGMNPMMMQMQRLSMNPNNAQNFQSADSSDGYRAIQIPVKDWNPEERTAHQLRPLRMAIIAGSFPYKNQLEEHKTKLRLASTDAVLNEQVETSDGKKAEAFRFLGIEVQRKEVDANGNTINDWALLELGKTYQLWLKNTWVPFQQEDPKLEQVRFPGLAMPLLREFRVSQTTAPGIPGMAQLMGMMNKMQQQPGAVKPAQTTATNDTAEGKEETHYPNVIESLPKIQATLAELNKEQTQQVAAPRQRTPTLLDPFNPNAVITTDNPQPAAPDPKQAGANESKEYIPEHVLARAVDVTIEPGKHYRYRLRIKMANPNYKNPDVASPDYKEGESLVSKDWKEIQQTVSVPPELRYYVVDEKQGSTRNDRNAIPVESAQAELWRDNPKSDQVVMQFQRWVESTQRSRKDSDLVSVGEWAVADRVLVSRGEYVGRKVKVDLPIWVYTRNAFILPVENQKERARNRKVKTGIDVDFGQENPDSNMILIDFEGGKVSSTTAKLVDNSVMEVLMLGPDGKLLARNNMKDTNDEERKKNREEVMKRIQDVRTGIK